MLTEPLGADDDADAIAADLLDALAAPFPIRGEELRLGASIGVALGAGGESPEQLLGHADVAMYAAKATGKRAFRRYEPTTARPGAAAPSFRADVTAPAPRRGAHRPRGASVSG